MGKLFPMDAVACREGVPDDCLCGASENPRGLQIRYSRVQGCPHPVFEDVVHFRTFTADGARIDDLMLKDGQLHGAAISWHPNGQVSGIANFEQRRQIGFSRAWHANGQLAAEQRYVDGALHGIEIRYDEAGHPEAVIARNHGEPDRERSAELAQSLGLESPLRDTPESPAGPDR